MVSQEMYVLKEITVLLEPAGPDLAMMVKLLKLIVNEQIFIVLNYKKPTSN